MKRKKLSPARSQRLFHVGATRTVRQNISARPMRGGIRL